MLRYIGIYGGEVRKLVQDAYILETYYQVYIM